jgi:ADP-ribose pyrophosphatase
MRELGGFFTTPGFIDEFIHVFMAHGLENGAPSHERDEFISLETLTIQSALAFVEEGRIIDGKTIVSLFLADRARQKP